jgi:Right handed beta helix region
MTDSMPRAMRKNFGCCGFLRPQRLLQLPLLLLVSGVSLHAATFFVAQREPYSSDDGPGSSAQPWKTLSHAAQTARPGDRVLIRGGTYRERVVVKTSGTAQEPIRFEAAPGAQVVLTGADRLTRWRRVEPGRPIYAVAWPHRFITWSPHMTHPEDEYHRLIGRCEQVAIDNYLLRQVLDPGQLAPGTFFVDTSNQVLKVWDAANRDPNKVLVEASVRQEILRLEGQYVEVRGLRFRFAANMAQHGAVVLAGAHDLLEDCVLEDMNSSGATFAAPDQVVRRCVFRDNGQLGFGANGAHRLLFTGCRVENNNTKGFNRGWEAGGDKLVLCRDAVLEHSRFERNRGNGLWFDIGNEHCTVRQCLIADNDDSGIFYEISFGLQAQDNVIIGNGFAHTAGAWGAQAGISLSSSPDCLIERNLIYGNREGFDFREQTRTTPRIGRKGEVPVWNHDELIRHNLIAFNRDAQVWGWFDVKDNRHWPAPAGAKVEPAHDSSALRPAQPLRLTLPQLRLRFEQNCYFAGPGQGWFDWGVPWARHQRYPSLAAFQGDLGLDTGSLVLDPGFSSPAALDFRLSRQTLEQLQDTYPRGPVPGVRLGVVQP